MSTYSLTIWTILTALPEDFVSVNKLVVVVPKILAGENRGIFNDVPGPHHLPYSLYCKFHMTIVLRDVTFCPLYSFSEADPIELDDFNILYKIGKA